MSKVNRELFRGLLRDEETEAQLVLWFEHAMVRAWFYLGVLWKSEEAGPHSEKYVTAAVLEKKIHLPSPHRLPGCPKVSSSDPASPSAICSVLLQTHSNGANHGPKLWNHEPKQIL